ncbi:MAG: HMA2 domain-containing protein [Thermodesulfovibrionales bacterium]|jgi:hypothetical protein
MFYIHNVPGKVRIISEAIKANPQAANEVLKGLTTLAGVCIVHVTLTTGSILIHYNQRLSLPMTSLISVKGKDISTVQGERQMMNIAGRAFPESGQQS